jgi:chromosomal replication initiation ATPase DnaA
MMNNQELTMARPRGANTARKAAMYLIQRYRGVGNLEVGRLFEGVHYSPVSKALGKLKKEMASDKKLANFGDEIISQFKIRHLCSLDERRFLNGRRKV